jgi:hypothetical protein
MRDGRGGQGRVTYRSPAGLVIFGAWSGCLLILVAYVVRSAPTEGASVLWFGAWMAGILGLGAWSMSVQADVMPDGEIVFRFLAWRRRWHLAQLRSIGPGTGCVVFRFDRGSTMVASFGSDDAWAALVARIRDLNPEVKVSDGYWSSSGER